MTDLFNYMQDGANCQARAVLAMVQGLLYIDSEGTTVYVSRWLNAREQGYVISLRTPDYAKQINIAFFEHRNSDTICAVVWEQFTINSPTIHDAQFGDVYKDKYDVSFQTGFGEILDMARWITDSLHYFHNEHLTQSTKS